MTFHLGAWALAALVVAQVGAGALLRGRLKRRGVAWPVFFRLLLALAVAVLLLHAVFTVCALNAEQHAVFLWGWVAVAAVLAGVGAAAWTRRMPVVELGAALLVVLEAVAAWVFFQHAPGGGFASTAVRSLLAAPVALGLCAYFGVSVGYLLWGAGGIDARLGYESLVGRRFLLSKASPVLSVVTTISVVGVTLGVWLVLVSLGVLAGFESDLQRKIMGANAHVVLHSPGVQPVSLEADTVARVRAVAGVAAVAPYIEGEVALAGSSNYSGGVLFGVDPQQTQAVLSVFAQLSEGSIEPLVQELGEAGGAAASASAMQQGSLAQGDAFVAPAAMANIVIGSELAKNLNVTVGDRVRVLSPTLEVLTPLGVAPKSLGFRVAAIFSTKMYEFDARFAYVSLPAARRFFELAATEVTGLQVATVDAEYAEQVGARAARALGGQMVALDWKRRNETLFSALKLERVVAFVVLVFIILVASFSIVNTLAMSVIEKRKEIAILKTMGARDVGIMKIFLLQGLLVGGFGTVMGAALAVATVVALERFGFQIPGEVYYIDSLPVRLEAGDVFLVVLSALLIVWDFAVFPALRGSRLEPVEGLRDG